MLRIIAGLFGYDLVKRESVYTGGTIPPPKPSTSCHSKNCTCEKCKPSHKKYLNRSGNCSCERCVINRSFESRPKKYYTMPPPPVPRNCNND